MDAWLPVVRSGISPDSESPFKWVRHRWWSIGLAILIGWSLIMTTLSLVFHTRPEPPKDRPIEVTGSGFTTSNTCKSCHPGNYESWHASYHRTMTQVGTPENIIPEVDGLELSHRGMDYQLRVQGNRVMIWSRLTNATDGSWEEPHQIALLTGSHTMQLYWIGTGNGRELVQFPLGYLIEEGIWAPVSQTFLVPPDFMDIYAKGEWNGACMDCHVTQGRPRYVEGGGFDSQVTEFGISCEACHSQGSEHIEQHRNPFTRFEFHLTDDRDGTVANPQRMDGETATMACAQCHSVWAFKGQSAKIEWDRGGSQFHPGQEDMPLRWLVQPKVENYIAKKQHLLKGNPDYYRDRFWKDGMIRVTGREANGILASPCYRGGQFSCLSCHEMHPDPADRIDLHTWANDQLRTDVTDDGSCLQCHAEYARDIASHTNHLADSSGSRCTNCHMPHTTFGLLRAIRSHQISSPTASESSEVGRPNACNLCHLDRTLEWTSEWLEKWYGQEAPTMHDDDRAIAASVKWVLKGDAGQRAITTWHLGWDEAQAISGNEWITPILTLNLNDPYAAVRFMTWKALRTLPGFKDFEYNYTSDEADTARATRAAYQKWWSDIRKPHDSFTTKVLLNPDGSFDQDTQVRLLTERDQTPIFLAE